MEKSNRPTVYISGPMTQGDWDTNIQNGIDAGQAAWEEGFNPYIPHLDALWGDKYPKDWEQWMEMDLVWVEKCDALLRIPGESKGADIEVAHAIELLKPVAYSIVELVQMFFPRRDGVINLGPQVKKVDYSEADYSPGSGMF